MVRKLGWIKAGLMARQFVSYLSIGLVFTLMPVAVPPADAAVEIDAPPLVLSGRLPADAHTLRLSVDVLPTAAAMSRIEVGKSLPVYRLPAAHVSTGARGYTVRMDPLALPSGYLDGKGLATLKVLAQDATTGALSTTVVSVRAVRSSTTAAPTWVSATESADPVVAPALRSIRGSAQLSTTAVAGGVVPDYCDSGASPRISKRAESLRWATIGTTYPAGRSTATMVVTSSQGAQYGIGVSMTGSYGSWDSSGSRHTESGWSKDWVPISTSRSYQKQVEYFKWKYEYLASACNHYHWIPNSETGGTASNVGIGRPDGWRRYCVHEDPGPWQRYLSVGSAYTYSESVKFAELIGIHLSISRQYSREQKLRYYIRGHHKYLCGSDTWPSRASKIVERRF
jgi:hypothetical protein